MRGRAAALMFVGLAFKVSAAPFQVWTPDVYQGAPTPFVAFLSVAPKAGGLAAVVHSGGPFGIIDWAMVESSASYSW